MGNKIYSLILCILFLSCLAPPAKAQDTGIAGLPVCPANYRTQQDSGAAPYFVYDYAAFPPEKGASFRFIPSGCYDVHLMTYGKKSFRGAYMPTCIDSLAGEGVKNNLFVPCYPNPVIDQVTTILNLGKAQNVQVLIYNSMAMKYSKARYPARRVIIGSASRWQICRRGSIISVLFTAMIHAGAGS